LKNNINSFANYLENTRTAVDVFPDGKTVHPELFSWLNKKFVEMPKIAAMISSSIRTESVKISNEYFIIHDLAVRTAFVDYYFSLHCANNAKFAFTFLVRLIEILTISRFKAHSNPVLKELKRISKLKNIWTEFETRHEHEKYDIIHSYGMFTDIYLCLHELGHKMYRSQSGEFNLFNSISTKLINEVYYTSENKEDIESVIAKCSYNDERFLYNYINTYTHDHKCSLTDYLLIGVPVFYQYKDTINRLAEKKSIIHEEVFCDVFAYYHSSELSSIISPYKKPEKDPIIHYIIPALIEFCECLSAINIGLDYLLDGKTSNQTMFIYPIRHRALFEFGVKPEKYYDRELYNKKIIKITSGEETKFRSKCHAFSSIFQGLCYTIAKHSDLEPEMHIKGIRHWFETEGYSF
jgi:hypothetical protein